LGALVRYALSGLRTIALLARERPRLLAVLNQPLPLILIAAAYARLTRAKLVLDGHSKPFAAPPASLYARLYRWATRACAFTINHNDQDAATVQQWGGQSIVFEALPFAHTVDITIPASAEPYVVCVCSFAADEPLEVILEAAKLLAPLSIRITGNWRKAGLSPQSFPPNLIPTGFLPTKAYYELLASAQAVITLSKRDWIMQMAVEEAMLLGVPVVTNFSPVLQKVLNDGAVFTTLNPNNLANAVQTLLSQAPQRKIAIQAAAQKLRQNTLRQISQIENIIAA
jgi:glycosyltransferase involved in cell wall biosynthesis